MLKHLHLCYAIQRSLLCKINKNLNILKHLQNTYCYTALLGSNIIHGGNA